MDTNESGITKALDSERKKLEEDREAFEKEKLVWFDVESKLRASQIGDLIMLNVGGTSFACSIELLQKIPDTYFSGLVSGRWKLNLQKDGSVFIDRDPAAFSLIMTYLRKYGTDFDLPTWCSTLSKRKKMLLADEAEFFILPDLAKLLLPMSAILDEEDWKSIYPSSTNRKLLYSSLNPITPYLGAIPGMKGQSNMLVVSMAKNGTILGAFTSVAWTFTDQWQTDPTAFLICKISGGVISKHMITSQGVKRAACQAQTFLAFGAGNDLYFDFSAFPAKNITMGSTSSSFSPISVSGRLREVRALEIWSLA